MPHSKCTWRVIFVDDTTHVTSLFIKIKNRGFLVVFQFCYAITTQFGVVIKHYWLDNDKEFITLI